MKHSSREYVRHAVHVNSVEGFNSRLRRTIAGVFHHISPQHADLYFHEIGFRWSHALLRARQCGKAEMAHENPVVAGAAGAAIPASLSRGYRPPNVQKPGWWDHRQISSRCLWLIKAMYPRESMAVVPRVRFELTPEKPGNLRWWSGVGTATMSRSHVDQ